MLIPAICLLVLPLPVPVAGGAAAGDTTYRTEDVRYRSGELILAAELILPAGAEAMLPGAVMIQGSGESDRRNEWARAIALELVAEGIAVLLTDKRGSGASAGDWRRAGFDELSDDAIAGVEYLRRRPELDPDRVGLVGLSQGGWVAPVAAARASDRISYVINVSGAAVSFAEQSFHEMRNTAEQAGLAPDQVEEVLALNRAAAEYLAGGGWDEYDRSRRSALLSDWAPIAEGFPGSAELPIWEFLLKVADFSPIPYWIALRQPVLVLYGEDDEEDNVPVAESVRRLEHAFSNAGKRNHRIAVIAGAGHAFLDPGTGELVSDFLDTLSAWVEANVTVPQPR
ncbi:MAG: alpha/beta fold hydrolase [Gemmatimonadota bacterium]